MLPTLNRSRTLRTLLWVPCILACITSIFAPETAGIVSRLASNQMPCLAHHRIRIPLSWFIDRYTDETHISAMTAPGIGRIGFQRYWRREVPLSDMGFFEVPRPEQNFTKNVPLEDVTILSKRSLLLGDESLNCWDLIQHNKFGDSRPNDPSVALISCSSDSEHFYAYFYGWRGDTAAFYDVLRGLNDVR